MQYRIYLPQDEFKDDSLNYTTMFLYYNTFNKVDSIYFQKFSTNVLSRSIEGRLERDAKDTVVRKSYFRSLKNKNLGAADASDIQEKILQDRIEYTVDSIYPGNTSVQNSEICYSLLRNLSTANDYVYASTNFHFGLLYILVMLSSLLLIINIIVKFFGVVSFFRGFVLLFIFYGVLIFVSSFNVAPINKSDNFTFILLLLVVLGSVLSIILIKNNTSGKLLLLQLSIYIVLIVVIFGPSLLHEYYVRDYYYAEKLNHLRHNYYSDKINYRSYLGWLDKGVALGLSVVSSILITPFFTFKTL